MKVWIKRCREPSEGTWTIVPYISDHEIQIDVKFRQSVVRRLLKASCGVYGGCNPVHKEVLHVIKHLHSKKLDKSLLVSLQKICTNNLKSGSLAFCRSRNYQEIIRWLSYELSRGTTSRNDSLSWKQKQRRLGEWY